MATTRGESHPDAAENEPLETWTIGGPNSNPTQGATMQRNLLLQSILGHLSLLQEKYPKKAASPVAQRVKRVARQSLAPSRRLAA